MLARVAILPTENQIHVIYNKSIHTLQKKVYY